MTATFQKEEILNSKKVIDQLFNSGKSFVKYPIRIVWMESNINFPYPAKVLISVPKKKIKKAVGRNRIKRLIREGYRKNKQLLYEPLTGANKKIVFAIIFIADDQREYAEIENKIMLSLQRLSEDITKN